jgi:uncharacterized protein
VLTLDTSAIYAILRQEDPDHRSIVRERDTDPGSYYIAAGILAEVAYLVETKLRLSTLDALLKDLQTGAYTLDCGEQDFARIRELVARYESLRLGFADAAVIACAERHGGRVLTADRRDFDVVARGEGTITMLPDFA